MTPSPLKRFWPAAVGFVALLTLLLLLALQFRSAVGSPALDEMPPPGAVAAPPARGVDADARFHAGVDFEALPVEPDPSPRAVAAYGSP